MPLFDYQCKDCGKLGEMLVFEKDEKPHCAYCGSHNLERLLSAHSSMSGATKNRMPGHGDTACCGSSPGEAADCAGPGSCCGKTFS